MTRSAGVRALDLMLAAGVALFASSLVLFRAPWTASALTGLRPEDVLVGLVVLVAARSALSAPRPPAVRPERAVAAGVVAYALVFSFVTVGRHYAFRTHALDLGQYAQSMWQLARGQEPYDTILGWHAWGNHFSPIFYPLAPLTLVFSGPAFLLVLQSVALALGAVPLFLLARARVGAGAAAAIALLYLLNPSLQGINVRDFHPAALAVPLLLTAMWAAERGYWLFFALATILTLATREDAAIAVVGLGLWLALAQRRWIAGGALAGISVVWLFVAIQSVMPAFREDATYPYLTAHYSHFGRSLGEILRAPFTHPLRVAGWLLTPDRALYLAALLAPLGFLPLAAPVASVGALSALAQNLLSDYPVLYNFRAQYQSFVLPFLMVGAIVGLQKLVDHRLRAPRWSTPTRVLALAAVVSLVLSAPTANDLAFHQWWPDARHRAAYRLLAMIPNGATVSASERFFPHLYERTTVYVFPGFARKSDVVLVDGARLAQGRIDRVSASRDGDVIALENQAGGALRLTVIAEAEGWLLLRPEPATAIR